MAKGIQFVIPAAGAGTRFAKVGYNIPKPLIPILGIPMICWVLSNLDVQPEDTIYILKRSNHDYSEIEETWLKKFDSQIKFIDVDELTAGAAITASKAFPYLDMTQRLVIANSDQFLFPNLSKFNDYFHENSHESYILTMKASSNKWSYVERDAAGNIKRVEEKVEISDEATVGIYSWSRAELFQHSLNKMIAADDRVNSEFYVAPTYNYLISENLPVKPFHVGTLEKNVFGLGTPEDLDRFLADKSIRVFFADTQKYFLN